MKYWLMKSEPNVYSIDHLSVQKKKTDHWDGIRNYQARNFIRDDMGVGDLAFFYHSNCDTPAIVGIMEIVSFAYPDHTAFDLAEKYYDPKSDPDNPRWFMVNVRLKKKFRRHVTLMQIRSERKLESMRLVQKGNRLSILPLTKREWNHILSMAGEPKS
jgi:predicted RNA-binding protein with PUA-like domain